MKTTFANAPVGTKAPHQDGGHWVKEKTGWRWHDSFTLYSIPGSKWTGEFVLPEVTTDDDGRKNQS